MSEKTDKEIAAEILIAALAASASSHAETRLFDLTKDTDKLAAKLGAAFTVIYQSVTDCDKHE